MARVIDILQSVGLLVIGALITAAVQWIRARRRAASESRGALRNVDHAAEEVVASVGHGHDFKDKKVLANELKRVASAHRRWLEGLDLPLTRIAERIRTNDFLPHDRQDPPAEYCCDELLADLHSFALALLWLAGNRGMLSVREQNERARRHLEALLLNTQGVVLDLDAQVEQMYGAWTAGAMKELGPEFAVARWWNERIAA